MEIFILVFKDIFKIRSTGKFTQLHRQVGQYIVATHISTGTFYKHKGRCTKHSQRGWHKSHGQSPFPPITFKSPKQFNSPSLQNDSFGPVCFCQFISS